jgi:hypothetical protein
MFQVRIELAQAGALQHFGRIRSAIAVFIQFLYIVATFLCILVWFVTFWRIVVHFVDICVRPGVGCLNFRICS